MKATLPSPHLGSFPENNAPVIHHDIVPGEGGLPIIHAKQTICAQPGEAEGCCFLGPDRRLAWLWQTYMAEVGRLVRFYCCVVQAKDLLVGEGLEPPTLAGFRLTGAATWLESREFCCSWCYVGNNFVLSGIREAAALVFCQSLFSLFF